MRDPEKLRVYLQAQDLAVGVYELCRKLRGEEDINLRMQMRRAADSIPDNIAEGCCRETQKEYVRALDFSTGSGAELRGQLKRTIRIFQGIPEIEDTIEETNSVMRQLASLKSSLRSGR